MTDTATTRQPEDDPAGPGPRGGTDDPEPEHPHHHGRTGEAGDGTAERSDLATTTVLPAAPGSVPAARAWVRDQLEHSKIDGEVLAHAELLVSEIATNAVLHTTSTQLKLRLATGPTLEISVHDQDPDGDPRRLHPAPDEDHGRGLAIVETVSHSWGIRRTPTGKTVWFRLDPTRSTG